MNHLLLLTYYFPPEPEAGALRPSYLVKYLSDHGWATTVITRLSEAPKQGHRTRSRRSTLAAITPLRAAKQLFLNTVYFPDAAIYWLPTALREARHAIKHQRFDAVMSTALPATMHLAGATICQTYGLPWIADYRDLWNGNPYRHFGPARSMIEKQLEQSILRRATAVTVVSPDMVAALRALKYAGDIHVIPNVYDPADWDDIPDHPPGEFRFCFGGRLYNGIRSPELIFAAVAELKAAGEQAGLNARFDFYGPDVQFVRQLATRYGLDSGVRTHGTAPRRQFLCAQRESAVLLLLLSFDSATRNEYGSKIFEYMGAQRPVLAIGGADSAVGDLLQRAEVGVLVTELHECKAAIRSLFGRFVDGRTQLAHSASLDEFTAPHLAGAFAQVLETVCSARRSHPAD